MVAEDWAVVTIESLLKSGAITAHKDGNYGSQYPRVEEFGSVGIPFLTAKSLNEGKIDIDGAPRLSEERANELRFGFVRPGDVLLSHNATIGRVAVVPKFEGRLLVGTSLTYFRVDPDKISPRYLAAYFSGSDFQNQLAAVMSLSTRNQVPITAQRRLHVVLPPVAEQNAIAHVLGTLDDKIDLNRRMNETLEAMARAIFKSWFVDFDPVRAKAQGRQPFGMNAETAALFPDAFEDSSLGKIPKGWCVGKLSELASLSRESVNPTGFPDEVFQHYSIPAFDEGRWPKQERGAAIKSNKFLVLPNSVLISKLNPRFPRVWLPAIADGSRSIASTEFLVAFAQQPFSREYLFGLFTAESFFEVFATLVTGTSSSHQRVRPEFLQEMDAVIPPKECIASFTRIVGQLYAKVAANLNESRTLSAIRDALLPKLISGELRVPASDVSEVPTS